MTEERVHILSKDCWCEPEVDDLTSDFDLGEACDVNSIEECESCQ